MQIRASHPVVKFAYLFQGQEPPERFNYDTHQYELRPTSLCPLFWRCVLNGVAILGAIGLVALGVFFGGRFILRHWRVLLQAITIATVSLLSVLGLVFAMDGDKGLGFGKKIGHGAEAAAGAIAKGSRKVGVPLVWQMIKTVKGTVCPVVTFVKD